MKPLISSAVLVCLFSCIASELAAQNAGMPLSIDPKPRVSIGVLEGDTVYELNQVVTPFLLPDGKVVIPLRQANTIRVFSASGVFIKSYGGAGSGPGEFRGIVGAWPRGDTIEAADFRLVRI